MKKLFISQPMRGKTDEQILQERNAAVEKAEKALNESAEIIDSFFCDIDIPDDADQALWMLGKSLELLATADIAYFAPGWSSARGCRIEHECAVEYEITVIDGEEKQYDQ